MMDYNKKEIEFAREVWKLIKKYDLKQQDNGFPYFSNDADSRVDEIYISIDEVFTMKEMGYLD
jgi:hypothetical protein